MQAAVRLMSAGCNHVQHLLSSSVRRVQATLSIRSKSAAHGDDSVHSFTHGSVGSLLHIITDEFGLAQPDTYAFL